MPYQVLLACDEDLQQEREERKIGELSGDLPLQSESAMGYLHLSFFSPSTYKLKGRFPGQYSNIMQYQRCTVPENYA